MTSATPGLGHRWLSVLALLVSTPALAGTYAAMKDVPVTGGELRLKVPRAAPPMTHVPDVPPDAPPQAAPSPPAPVREAEAPSIGFPLRHTKVAIQVDGVMAQVEVEQLFENPFDDPLEATYLFPLDDEAAVHAYRIVIGDRVIEGVVKERKQARQDYEDARSAGHAAGLLEQQKDNVFEQSIANIAPRESVLVRLTYVQLADHDDDGWELSFPMVVGPRYLPETTTDPNPVGAKVYLEPGRPGSRNVAYLPPGTRAGHDIELSARVDPGVPIVEMDCPSHRVIQQVVDATTTEVALDPSDTLPNKDFVLRWRTAGDATGVGFLTHRTGDIGYVTLVVQPKAEYREVDIAPREILVVMDASGSMTGQPLQLAQAVARRIVRSAGPNDTINVFRFADDVSALSRAPVPADADGVHDALAYVDRTRVDGGTMLNDAVVRAFGTKPDGGRVRMIYLLTDGFIGNDEEVLDTVGRTTSYNRISTVGIGAAPNRYLLDRMAEIGRGVSATCGLNDSPEAVADEVLRHTAFPYLTDVTIDWGGLRVADVVPEVVPDIPAGKALVVSARYTVSGKGTVRVRGRVAGTSVEVPLQVELKDHEDRPGVEMLWVRRRVKALMNASHAARANLPRIEAEVTRLGITHQIVTRFTSFIAVDTSRVVTGPLKTVEQPVEMPEGVSWEGHFGRPMLQTVGPPPGYPASYGGGGGGGGSLFDDVDPITIAGVAAFLLVVLVLKRRSAA